MRRAKTIDEIYNEVKDYDLVICNDAPLALALNNRLDKPHVGTFAVTPRQLASDLAMDTLGQGIMSGIEIVKKVSAYTGYPIRYVHGEIENFKTIRRYTPEVDKGLSKRSRTVYREYRGLPTLDRVMEEFDRQPTQEELAKKKTDPGYMLNEERKEEYYKGKTVAVVGSELFDSLDKHMPPINADFIEMFDESVQYRIPEIIELSNDRQIAENAVALIDENNASDVAIVMDVKGPISDAVRSALYRKRLPFINSLDMRDLSHIRDYLEFLSLAQSFETVKVAQVRELVSACGGRILSKYDEYLVSNYLSICSDGTRTRSLLTAMRDAGSMTYSELSKTVMSKENNVQVVMLLDEMDLRGRKVNDQDTEDMTYAVNEIKDLKHNVQIPPEEKEGVLLVDCQNAVFIDRPVVIFIGMGDEWERDLSMLDLVGYELKDDENEKNMWKFEMMVQQGTRRIYLCNATRDGKEARPCDYFDQLGESKGTAASFGTICNKLNRDGPWYRPPDEIPKTRGDESVDNKITTPKAFSKSSFNYFVVCPRAYMFCTMLSTPDRSDSMVGTLIHSYAEFKINYPDLAKGHDADYYTKIIADQCYGLFTSECRAMAMSNIRCSIMNLDSFIESHDFSKLPRKMVKKEQPSIFMQMNGLDRGSDITEINVTSADRHLHGIFDLVAGGTVYDYKTGGPKPVKDILKLTKEPSRGRMEFQCLFYLSLLDEKLTSEGKSIDDAPREFDLFYTADNESKAAHGIGYDANDNLRHVILVDNKEEWFRTRFMDEMLQMKSYGALSPYRQQFIGMVESIGLDKIDDEAAKSIDARMGLKKDLAFKAAKKAGKAFANTETFSFDSDTKTIYITRKGLNDFKEQISAAYEAETGYMVKDHPAKTRIHCEDCDFYDVCTAKPVDVDDGGDDDE
jgi:hypothetical protein